MTYHCCYAAANQVERFYFDVFEYDITVRGDRQWDKHSYGRFDVSFLVQAKSFRRKIREHDD